MARRRLLSRDYCHPISVASPQLSKVRIILLVAARILLTWLDMRIVTIYVITCIFEGTMYLFVVFWSPAIASARRAAGVRSDPPFGLIFASFMAAMMLGSMSFGIMMPSAKDSSVLASYFLGLLLPVASSCLSWAILSPKESAIFWAFCLFELCIGIYFPSMGILKGHIIKNASRGNIYSLLRIPLNIFVVIGLVLTEEGEPIPHITFTKLRCGVQAMRIEIPCSWSVAAYCCWAWFSHIDFSGSRHLACPTSRTVSEQRILVCPIN